MSYTDDGIFIPIRIRNPFSESRYPEDGELLGLLDTGYSGFLLVPTTIFKELNLRKNVVSTGTLANGAKVELAGDYASVEIPSLEFSVDGLVQTSSAMEEVLLGLDGIRELLITLDSCSRRITFQKC